MKKTSTLSVLLALACLAVSCTKDDGSGKTVISNPDVNLSEQGGGTANCYIVEPNKVIAFNAEFKGNSATEIIEGAAAAKVVWQSKADLVKSIAYNPQNKTIVAEINDIFGNSVVAVTDGAGTILWSWHLWVVDYDPAASLYTTEANASGTTWTFMSRNLGALTEQRGSFESFGLLYQWGRKDPFPATIDFTVMNPDDYTYEVDGEPTLYDGEGNALKKIPEYKDIHGTIAKSIQNPMTFYYMTYNHTGEYDENNEEIVKNDYVTGDWTSPSDDDYWGGVSMKKTIYDPCPVGYKVPVCDADGNTPYAWLKYASMTWDTEKMGAEQNGQWFPATGTRAYASGTLDFPKGGNPYSGLWIGTAGKASSNIAENPDLYGQYMFIINGKRTFKVNKDKRSQGLSLRCVKE